MGWDAEETGRFEIVASVLRRKSGGSGELPGVV